MIATDKLEGTDCSRSVSVYQGTERSTSRVLRLCWKPDAMLLGADSESEYHPVACDAFRSAPFAAQHIVRLNQIYSKLSILVPTMSKY